MELNKEDLVLFFPTWYPVTGQVRSGNAIRRMARAISDDLNVVVLYVGGSNQIKKRTHMELSVEDGIYTYRFLYKRNNLYQRAGVVEKVKFLFWHLYLSFSGFKYVKNKHGKPKLIHVHVLTRNAILALFFKLTNGVKYCITERWSRYFEKGGAFRSFFHRIITKFVVKESEGITAVSFALRAAMQQQGIKHRIFGVIPNVVDQNIFVEKRHQKNNIPIFIHISCFNDHDKNISGIIRAANAIDKLGYVFQLKLIGDGVHKQQIENLVFEMQWQHVQVRFEGEKKQDELPVFYNEADALVIFSNYETFCNVVAEAHCCGLPVIATRIAALPELVNETNGLLVTVKDEWELAEAMMKFCKEEVAFDRHQIGKLAASVYSAHSVKQTVQAFYKSL